MAVNLIRPDITETWVSSKTEEGKKHDSGKDRWELMPWKQLTYVTKVLTGEVGVGGAAEYGDWNWQKVEPISRYQGALGRHMVAYMSGEKIDPKSRLPHLAHLVCNALFLMWFDDQVKP